MVGLHGFLNDCSETAADRESWKSEAEAFAPQWDVAAPCLRDYWCTSLSFSLSCHSKSFSETLLQTNKKKGIYLQHLYCSLDLYVTRLLGAKKYANTYD